MTALGLGLHRPLQRRQLRTGAAVGAAVPVLTLAVLAFLAGRSSSPPLPAGETAARAAERAALSAYEQAVDAAVEDGGFAVTQGMQPGVADIAEDAFPDEELVTMASGWRATMESVRADLAAVEPPAFLREVARLYDEALAAYVEVAEALLTAARAAGEERAALIEKVPPVGRGADELWDTAQAEWERHATRLGVTTERRRTARAPGVRETGETNDAND